MRYLLLMLAIPAYAQTIKSSSVGTSEASCSQVSGGDIVCKSSKVGIGTKAPSESLQISSGTIHFDGTGSPAAGAALCINAAGKLSVCSSVVGAGGTCTCT